MYTYESLKQRQTEAEQRYDELQRTIDNAQAEQFRLQGEHRLLRMFIESLESDPATKIEVKEEAQDGTTTTE